MDIVTTLTRMGMRMRIVDIEPNQTYLPQSQKFPLQMIGFPHQCVQPMEIKATFHPIKTQGHLRETILDLGEVHYML